MRISVILLMMSLLFACSKSSTCLTPKVVGLRGGFYYRDSATLYRDTILTNANLFFGSAQQYFANLKRTSKYHFSLSQSADSVIFYFQSDSLSFEPETIDSVTIHYLREPHFISTACGYETYFSITGIHYSTNVIDTILISFADITNDVNKEHLKIAIKK